MRDGTGPAAAGDEPATWRGLFASGEYRALWVAQAISLVGDQLARVALAWLVFSETHSALLTATVWAITFLPWLIGGPLLGGLADRLSRRSIMVGCNLTAAVLVAVMAVPALPLGARCVLLFAVVLVEPLFTAARSALIADVLPDDRYVLASATNNITSQSAFLFGFAAGGGIVAAIGPRPALLLDAATFLFSAVVVRLGVRHRPPASADTDGEPGLPGWVKRVGAGMRLVFGDQRLRGLVLLAWLAAFYVVPEGLATPYAAALGGSATTVGLLLAAQPLGAVVGAVLISRLVPPQRRLVLLLPLAALACAPLVLCAFRPGLAVTMLLWAVSGLGMSYQLAANAAFVQIVPSASRGQAFGLATAGLVAGQGLAILLAGALADRLSPPTVVAIAGGAGLLGVLALSGVGRRLATVTTPAAA